MRIGVISEKLSNPVDEGIKKFAFSVMKALSSKHQVLGMSIGGLSEGGLTVAPVRMNKLMLNWKLWRSIRRFSPDVIIYIPSSSGTISSFLRARVLKWHGRGIRVILISLQSRSFSDGISKWASRFRLCPDEVITPSRQMAEVLAKMGCTASVLPAGVDTESFRPVSSEVKEALRQRYDLPVSTFVLLHVGHINPRRGVSVFKDIQKQPGIQVVLVGSTSTPQDEALSRELENSGVRVLKEYIPSIQEIYQLADCYLFQVSSRTAAIELPLSVLEAMACNLPVVTTRFGGLADHFSEGEGLLFAETFDEVLEKISKVREGLSVHTRSLVTPFTWENMADTFGERYLQ
jgi:glycosyltransferase involved in cell wall biosynthesis